MAQLPRTYEEMMAQVPNFMQIFNGAVDTKTKFVPIDPTPLELEIMAEVFEAFFAGLTPNGSAAVTDAEKQWISKVFFTGFMSGMNFASNAVIRLHHMKTTQN